MVLSFSSGQNKIIMDQEMLNVINEHEAELDALSSSSSSYSSSSAAKSPAPGKKSPSEKKGWRASDRAFFTEESNTKLRELVISKIVLEVSRAWGQ